MMPPTPEARWQEGLSAAEPLRCSRYGKPAAGTALTDPVGSESGVVSLVGHTDGRSPRGTLAGLATISFPAAGRHAVAGLDATVTATTTATMNRQNLWRTVAHYGASSEGRAGFSGEAFPLIIAGSSPAPAI
jgi:hypothetical protein